jgi:hypothetical protein
LFKSDGNSRQSDVAAHLSLQEGELMSREVKPILPILLPWRDYQGNVLNIENFLRTRKFTLIYAITIVGVWNFIGSTPHWSDCYSVDFQITCATTIWAGEMFTSPINFLISFFTAPWFHNSYQHIFFVTFCTLIFTQSFEGINGTKATIFLFFGIIAIVSIICGLSMHIGHYLFPEYALFSDGLQRIWSGGSVGFMGLIGALANHSRYKWLMPAMLFTFEFWNRYFNGISTYITLAHLMAATIGFFFWGWYIREQQILAENSGVIL